LRKKTRVNYREVLGYRKRNQKRGDEIAHLPEAGTLAIVTFVYVGRAASAELSDERREAVLKELAQMHDYDVLQPIQLSELTPEELARAVPSVMLISDKIAPDGTFLKVKARFVVKGYMEAVDDSAAPTISTNL